MVASSTWQQELHRPQLHMVCPYNPNELCPGSLGCSAWPLPTLWLTGPPLTAEP